MSKTTPFPSQVKVPFNRPLRIPEHESALNQPCLKDFIAGNGPLTKSVENELEESLRVPVRLVSSATHAMELMALLADIHPGDEVICPSFTFVSTANAFALRGARIRFADNDEFGNILPSEIERLSNSKTKAAIAVDYAGNSADMTEIQSICRQKKIFLFEDAAQAIGSKFKGSPLGTFGSLGCYSFHETKNITSGEGGALIFGDRSHLPRAEILREKGTNRNLFLQGLADKYTWVDLGSSYVLSELCVAYLAPQVSQIDKINGRRAQIWNRYAEALRYPAEKIGAKLLDHPLHNQPNNHLFAMIFAEGSQRTDFIQFMREAGIICPFHYVSLHSSPFGRQYAEQPLDLPGCQRLSERLVRLPLFYNMSDEEQSYVLENILTWIKQS